jgi:hypothetical protein
MNSNLTLTTKELLAGKGHYLLQLSITNSTLLKISSLVDPNRVVLRNRCERKD